METNVNYTTVGAFVLLLLGCITLGIIWLSAGFSVAEYEIYEVRMKEAVNGLSVDATVEYNGVNVGTVKSVQLNQKNPQLVELLLSVKNDTPITRGTRATLNIKGITGIAYVALHDKGTDMTPLRAAPGQEYPIIPTSPSLLLRLDTALNKLNENIHQVSSSLQALLNPENLRSITNILHNINNITHTVSVNDQQLNTVLQNAANASQQFPALLTNLDSVTTEIKQNPAMLIRGREQPTLGPGEK